MLLVWEPLCFVSKTASYTVCLCLIDFPFLLFKSILKHIFSSFHMPFHFSFSLLLTLTQCFNFFPYTMFILWNLAFSYCGLNCSMLLCTVKHLIKPIVAVFHSWWWFSQYLPVCVCKMSMCKSVLTHALWARKRSLSQNLFKHDASL